MTIEGDDTRTSRPRVSALSRPVAKTVAPGLKRWLTSAKAALCASADRHVPRASTKKNRIDSRLI